MMEYKKKPTFVRRVLAYLAAAVVFSVLVEIILQAICLIKTGAFMPMDEAHIACIKFTFFFLLLAGFLIVSIGHFAITLSSFSFQSVKRRHSFAYAIGYMVFVTIGIACMIYINPAVVDMMASGWWAYIISAIILFISALIAGKAFAHIYDQSPKLS